MARCKSWYISDSHGILGKVMVYQGCHGISGSHGISVKVMVYQGKLRYIEVNHGISR